MRRLLMVIGLCGCGEPRVPAETRWLSPLPATSAFTMFAVNGGGVVVDQLQPRLSVYDPDGERQDLPIAGAPTDVRVAMSSAGMVIGGVGVDGLSLAVRGASGATSPLPAPRSSEGFAWDLADDTLAFATPAHPGTTIALYTPGETTPRSTHVVTLEFPLQIAVGADGAVAAWTPTQVALYRPSGELAWVQDHTVRSVRVVGGGALLETFIQDAGFDEQLVALWTERGESAWQLPSRFSRLAVTGDTLYDLEGYSVIARDLATSAVRDELPFYQPPTSLAADAQVLLVAFGISLAGVDR